MNAVNLPIGSVVATGEDAYIKQPGVAYPWAQTGSHGRLTDAEVTKHLRSNVAQILRVGDGSQ